jgi:Fe-S cluster assembly iron-binding protein IscA
MFSYVKRRKVMLSVTFSAKEKLKNILQEERKDEESLISIARTSSNPQQIGFALDKEKEGDHVIEDNDGESLLLIKEDLAPILSGFVLDYRDTGQGMRFTITRS